MKKAPVGLSINEKYSIETIRNILCTQKYPCCFWLPIWRRAAPPVMLTKAPRTYLSISTNPEIRPVECAGEHPDPKTFPVIAIAFTAAWICNRYREILRELKREQCS